MKRKTVLGLLVMVGVLALLVGPVTFPLSLYHSQC
jgi:hypothetical protein